MAGEIKTLEFSEGVSVSSPFDAGSGSGTGEVNFVANNNGAADLDQTQTDDVGDWLDSGTGTTSSITTSSGEIPRFPFQETAIKITNDGSGTAYTQIRFRVPPADRNKKLKIEFAQKPDGSIYATGDFTLELYNYSDNYSTGETQVSIVGADNGIPNQTGISFFEFDSDNREYYELRFVRSAGSASGFIAINDFVVGPGKLHSGGVVTAWESFTPTLINDTAISATKLGRKRRVGDSIDIEFYLTMGADGTDSGVFQLTIPDSLNIEENSSRIYGNGFAIAEGASDTFHTLSVIGPTSGTTSLRFVTQAHGAQTLKVLAGTDLGTSSGNFRTLAARMQIEITEWQNSGVLNTLVQDNLTEWKSYDSPWDALSSSVSIGNGVQGGRWRRVGQSMEVEVDVSMGSTTTYGTGDYIWSIPSGYTIDISLIESVQVNNQALGVAWARDSDASSLRKVGVVHALDETTVRVAGHDDTGNWDQTDPFTWAENDDMTLKFSVPIVEFAGSQSSLVGFTHAQDDQMGLVRKNIWQTKNLTSDVTSTTATISDLTFSNLTIGRTYRVSAQARLELTGTSATEAISFTATHNATTIFEIDHRNDAQTDVSRATASGSSIFVATATNVTFGVTVSGTGALRGNNSKSETWAMIEELDNYGDESIAF